MIGLALAVATTIGSIGAAEQEVVPPPLPPIVRIGDDVCAIKLAVDCQVSDKRGQPVVGAKLSGLQQWMKAEGNWETIALTGATGRAQGWLCLQSSSVYLSSPPTGQVTLRFQVTKAGYPLRELEQVVDAEKLLHDGLLVRRVDTYVVPDLTAIRRNAAYKVRLRTQLGD